MCKLCDKINDKEFQEMLDSDPELKKLNDNYDHIP